ncbi:MAG: magnesium/cobalt transporter CorA [Prosthecochloris sp.]|uniref:magnesium/cobalt transporter CorA n=1 Tax=Prosthecochloris sp. TaxID=290513 RepID=UPI00258C200B|nr:magnesium/cobalt transporter CorA [Prosthecochloris sp.]MCW8798318.1 magnesium/cobalt transporter CorA [Prosthecochloris sp.]
MAKFSRNYSRKIGLPAGSLIHLGEKKQDETRISVIDFNEAHVERREVRRIEDCLPYKQSASTTWINIDGLGEVDVIADAGRIFDINALVLEDILHTGQRPKIEEYENIVFCVLRMISYDEEQQKVSEEQLSLVLGKGILISFQEKPGDIFNSLRERLVQGKSRIRTKGADYLAYALIDIVIDNYFDVLDKVELKLERLDEELFSDSSIETFREISDLKKELIQLRKSTWPLREIVNSITKNEFSVIDESNLIYFRDVYDHTIHVIDILETLRDMVAAMHDTYMNYVNNRMNEVMKVLTVIATIFIPLTFIAGVYGMNFRYMPELEWRWGYFGALGVMGLIVVGMVLYFKRKKWF